MDFAELPPDPNSPKQRESVAVSNEERKAHIAALLRERRGYEIWSNQGGMDAVDAELRRIGYEASPPRKRAERRPAPNVEKR